MSSTSIDSKATVIQEPVLLACQPDLVFLLAAPDPGLYQQTSIADDDELSDIVDWDNLSVDLEADENQNSSTARLSTTRPKSQVVTIELKPMSRFPRIIEQSKSS